jgi:hypothetical protein
MMKMKEDGLECLDLVDCFLKGFSKSLNSQMGSKLYEAKFDIILAKGFKCVFAQVSYNFVYFL